MGYLPLHVNFQGRKCVIIGGGRIAQKKLRQLLPTQARIHLISPHITRPILRIKEPHLRISKREFHARDLQRVFLVISATNNPLINREIAHHCFSKGILINCVDDPKHCNVMMPAVLKRGAFRISISTDGKSPALSAFVRDKLGRQFGQEYGKFLDLLGSIRPVVARRFKGEQGRKRVYREILNSRVLHVIRKKRLRKAKQIIQSIVGLPLWQ